MDRMPGNEWQKFAQLRLLYGYMFTHPGTQLLFMGDEFAQTSEWSHGDGLKWELLQYDYHQGIKEWVKDLNHYYKNTPALYVKQFDEMGFQWLHHADWENSTLQYLRRGAANDNDQIVICNFTPVQRDNYRIGVPYAGTFVEKLNSSAKKYGGDDILNTGERHSEEGKQWEWENYITINIPPFATLIFETVKIHSKKKVEVVAAKSKPVDVDPLAKEILLQQIGTATVGEKDDLKKISGVGPKLEKMLNGLGIYTYLQVSKMTDREYEQVDLLIGRFQGRAKRDEWAKQAKKLTSND